jgi:glutamate racemase
MLRSSFPTVSRAMSLRPDPIPQDLGVSPGAAADPQAAARAMRAPLRIGVYDSGVGGLSVLRAIRARLPRAELLYAADTGFAPYGDRPEADIHERARRVVGFLRDRGAQVVVIACNTATTVAVGGLRGTGDLPPIVGVEPGVKPAVAMSATGRVGVLATTRTVTSDKLRRLVQAHGGGARILLQACPGLADTLESVDAGDPALAALVERYSAPLREAGVDVAVLGCTHYVFARALFERALPGVRLVDTADAVARQTARVAAEVDERVELAVAAAAEPPPSGAAFADGPALQAFSSGDPDVLAGFARRWLAWRVDVRAMDC